MAVAVVVATHPEAGAVTVEMDTRQVVQTGPPWDRVLVAMEEPAEPDSLVATVAKVARVEQVRILPVAQAVGAEKAAVVQPREDRVAVVVKAGGVKSAKVQTVVPVVTVEMCPSGVLRVLRVLVALAEPGLLDLARLERTVMWVGFRPTRVWQRSHTKL